MQNIAYHVAKTFGRNRTGNSFALTWLIKKKQYGTKYCWKRSNNFSCVKQCVSLSIRNFQIPRAAYEHKGLWVFWLVEVPSMHPWKTLLFSKMTRKGARISEGSPHWNSFLHIGKQPNSNRDLQLSRPFARIKMLCKILHFASLVGRKVTTGSRKRNNKRKS